MVRLLLSGSTTPQADEVRTGKVGCLMIKSVIINFNKRTDYSKYGGIFLLGNNGTCIISHGRPSAKTIEHTIEVADEMAKSVSMKILRQRK